MREVNCDQGVHCEKTETAAGSDAYTLCDNDNISHN